MSASSKWSDAAVKDLTFAILMSNNSDGSVSVNANWDNVEKTMKDWGYTFTKSAMNQHWSKKILKEFKERHGGPGALGDMNDTPKKTAGTPRKPRTPKTPATGGSRGKKRAAEDDDDSSPEGYVPAPIARNKTPRSTSKRVKYEDKDDTEHVESTDEDVKDADTKAEAEDGEFGII